MCDVCQTPFAIEAVERRVARTVVAGLVISTGYALAVTQLGSLLGVVIAALCLPLIGGLVVRSLDGLFLALVSGTTIAAAVVTLLEPATPKAIGATLAAISPHWPTTWLLTNVIAVGVMLAVAAVARRGQPLDYNGTGDRF